MRNHVNRTNKLRAGKCDTMKMKGSLRVDGGFDEHILIQASDLAEATNGSSSRRRGDGLRFVSELPNHQAATVTRRNVHIRIETVASRRRRTQ